jgi:muramoyltetrapeptide carboxypeptidase
MIRIGVVAPGSRLTPEIADRVTALADAHYPDGAVRIEFHPQCFLCHGHFAGDDAARAAAFIEVANDAAYDALWIGRGGYGACRIAEDVLAELKGAARAKTYLGYSDAGFLLAGLYARGFKEVFHGPMPGDILREGGEAAVTRALAWLVERDPVAVEPTLAKGDAAAAFNIMILSQLLGTPLEPDLSGHVLMLEEVSEYMYRIDRSLFHVTSNRMIRRVAGIRLHRCSLIPPNDPEFAETEEEIVERWCARAGIPYLGRADIGHDAANKVVPFGRLGCARGPA